MADVKKTIKFDISMDAKTANNAIDSFKNKLNALNLVGKTVFRDLKNVSKTDLGLLKNEFSDTEKSIVSFKNALENGNINGDQYKKLAEELNKVSTKYNSLEHQMNKNLSATTMLEGFKDTSSLTNFGKSFKTVTASMTVMGDKVFKTMFSVAKTSTLAWGSMLKATFTKVTSGWKSALSSIFSTKTSSNQFTNMLRGALPYMGIAGLLALGKQAVTLSSNMIEVQNVTDTVFKSMSQSVDDFTENASSKFGMTSLQAKTMIGIFGGMLGASSIVGTAQAEMSKNLTALSGDLASFYNMNTTETFEKLQSGLTGEVKAMRAFGVNMTVANMQAYALSKGITESYDSMNQATKTTLRYNYMLDMLSDTQGDFSRTSMSWANQVRTLSNNFKQLLSVLGGGLITVFYPVLSVIGQITDYALAGANALASMFNFSAVDLSTILGSSGAAASDYTTGVDEATDATNALSDATAKASSNLQGFDKINNTDTSSSSAGKSNSSAGAGLSSINYDSYYKDVMGNQKESLNKRLAEIVATLKDFAKDIGNVDYESFKQSWSKLASTVGQSANYIGDDIKILWKKVLFPFYEWGMEQGAPSVLDLMAQQLKTLHSVIVAVSPSISRFWDSTLSPYFTTKGDNFISLMKSWTKELKLWTNGLDNSSNKVKYLETTITNLKTSLYSFIGDKGITSRIDSIGNHFSNIFNKLKTPEVKAQFESLLRTFAKLNLIVFDNLIGVFEFLVGNTKVTSFVDFFVTQFGELADYTFDALKEVIDYIAGSSDAKRVVTDIKEAIKNIIDWIVNNKETILFFIGKAADLLLFCSEHINTILGLFILIKGVGLFVGLTNGAAGFIKALETVCGAVGTSGSTAGLFGALSGLGALVGVGGAIALVELGIVAIGKAAYNSAKDAEKMNDAYKNLTVDKVSTANTDLNSSDKTFNVETPVAYANSIKTVTDAYNDLSDGVKELGQNGRESGLQILASTAKSDAENYVTALDSAGYANKELYDQLKALSETDISAFSFGEKEDYKKKIGEVSAAIQEELNTQSQVIQGKSAEQLAQWGSTFSNISAVNGEIAANSGVNAYSKSITDNLNIVDSSMGQVYNITTEKWTAISDVASTEGMNSVIGYADGMLADNQYLITATGQVFDTVTGTFVTLPEAFRQTAVSSINGMTVEFNADGSVASSVAGLLNNATSTASVNASSGGQSLGDFLLKGIQKGLGFTDGVLSSIKDVASGVYETLKSAWDINSPSRVFADLARYIPAGIAVGISDGSSVAYSSISSFASNLSSRMSDEKYDLSSLIDTSKFENSYNSALSQTDSFINSVNNKLTGIKSTDIVANVETSQTNKVSQINASIASKQSELAKSDLAALNSKIDETAKIANGKNIVVPVYLDANSKIGEIAINAVNGEAIKTGGF